MVGVCEESSQGVYNAQGVLDGVEEPPELHILPRYPLFVLHPQRGGQGVVTIHST